MHRKIRNYLNYFIVMESSLLVSDEMEFVHSSNHHPSFSLITIGPPEQAMWSLGDKIASTIIAQSADMYQHYHGVDLVI